MIRSAVIVASLVSSAPTATDAFAIACKGEIFREAVNFGLAESQKFDLPDQIFVFSESSNAILRAMPVRHEYERVCDIDGTGAQIEFAPDLIRSEWQSSPDWEARTSCRFEFNRTDGTASLWMQFEWSEARRSETEWRMSCTSAPVPSFDQ